LTVDGRIAAMSSVELRGELVRLRPVVEGDRERLLTIRRTEAVRCRWRGDDLDAEFDDALRDDELVQLAICTERDGVVGLIQFAEETDPEYRSASIDVFVDPAHHRRGYASDAIRALVLHLFHELGHHRLTIDPAAGNAAAIACYTRVGFRPVGIMRQHERQADGTWADALLMDMLASDLPPS
jgi:aminoglycoside 6'-N-acetyltransferase